MPRHRREFLLGSIAAAAALAGCSGPTDGGDATPTAADTPADAPADTPAATATPGGAEVDYGDWFADTQNYDGTTVDARGEPTVTVRVGVQANGGAFGFGPPAVWVDPGTTVRWAWTGEGGSHNVVAADDSFRSGDPQSGGDVTYEHTVDAEGTTRYFCSPHRGVGMKGAVVAGQPDAGGETRAYGWQAATWDSYWYSLYNMSTNVAMSGNGVRFPHNERQQQAFEQRLPAMLANAEADEPPIRNPWLNMAPFTGGDPHLTQAPDFGGQDGRPDAATLRWGPGASSQVVSPSSLAWTHLKGVTWAKNFQTHVGVLPAAVRPQFRAQLLTTLAQVGVSAALLRGGPENNGALTRGEGLELVSEFRPGPSAYTDDSPYTPPEPGYPDRTPRPHHHAAMLWFLSDLNSLAQGGWFGYVNPEPLIPARRIQQLSDGLAAATMNAFPAGELDSTRTAGLLLAAVGYYGPQAGGSAQASRASEYATALADAIEANTDSSGRIAGGAANQAATQGIAGQGLLWATEGLDGVDRTGIAESVLGYLVEDLWARDAGIFAAGTDTSTHTYTARDAGDITGGVNAAEAVLGIEGVKPKYARWFDNTFNRGLLQRAQRPNSVDDSDSPRPPLPPAAGGEFGQAAVYNAEVEYDAGADEWSVTDARFDTEWALYLANQDIWVSQWAGEFYRGRGVPGGSDEPPQ